MQPVQWKLSRSNAPWEGAHIQIKWMGCPSRNVGSVGISPYHHHTQFQWVTLAQGREGITGLNPGLIWVTENHHHAQILLSYAISEEDHRIGSSPLFFGLDWVVNSTPALSQLSGGAMWAKNPSNINLNWITPKHGSCHMKEYSSGKKTAIGSDLPETFHNTVLKKVLTSRRENGFYEDSCWQKVWYGNTWGSWPLVYNSKFAPGYWGVKEQDQWILN